MPVAHWACLLQNVFTKLYDSVVWPVINYSAPLWGFRSYSCIEAVHNRALRFFLGVGKYSPNDGISGDMGWKPPIVRQWKCISLYWSRLSNMNTTRINKRVALWAYSKASRSCRNWHFNVKNHYEFNDFLMYTSFANPISRSFAHDVEVKTFDNYINSWSTKINNVIGPSGRGRNKLRVYKLFKSDYIAEQYCKIVLPPRHRSAFCKFRLGVAPIRIETGRYEGLPEESRICSFCDINTIENELHVILYCPIYNDIRQVLFAKAYACNFNFYSLSDYDKYCFLFSNPDMIRSCAKTCFSILQRRQFLLCK